MGLTRGEMVAAPSTVAQKYFCEPLRVAHKIWSGQNLGAALHPGSDNAWRCPNALLIYQPMNRVSCVGPWKVGIAPPVSRPKWRNGERPFPSKSIGALC